MKHLLTTLLLAFFLSITVSCDKNDKEPEPPQMPIKNLVMPDESTPRCWGESVTIQGEGFIESSELWIGETDKRKAAIASRTSAGITFVVPQGVEGLHNVTLRQAGPDWLIGKLTFKAPALMPIKNLQMPDTNTPILGGTTVVILGEGFVASSEIWMQEPEDAKIENKTVVTQINGSQISFTAPEQANGLKKIILKQDNKEWELGQLTFKTLEMKPPKYFVAKMGTLGTTVLNQTQKDTITIMQLYGEINATDLAVLRTEMKKLNTLDLSEVTCENNIIPGGAFMGGFVSYIRNFILPKNLKRIEEFAFAQCGLSLMSPLVIPDGVTYIGEMAFGDNKFMKGDLVIPSSVTYIGPLAFVKCGCSSLSLPDELTTVGEFAFAGGQFKGLLKIPSSMTVIPKGAFSQCRGFTSLSLPSGLQSIGEEALAGLGITEPLILPSSLQTIGKAAFMDCKFKGDLVIPNNVTYIGAFAFQKGVFDGTLTLSSSLQTIDSAAFIRCHNLNGDLTIPNSVTSMGKYAFKECDGFNGRLTLSNQLKVIESFTFSRNEGHFTGPLTIPNSVTLIDTAAFQKAGFDGTLTLNENLITIEEYAFSKCTFTGSLTIPDGVQTIGERAFQQCKKFDGPLTLPKELIKLKREAFRSCGFTGPLTIPDKLTTIERAAFAECSNLNGKVTIPIGVTKMEPDVFYGCVSVNRFRVSWLTPLTGVSQTTFPLKVAVFEVPRESLALYRKEWGKHDYRWGFIGY